MGPALDPHAAFLIQRGMRTYFLRYERQCASAIVLAEYSGAASPRKASALPGPRAATRSTGWRENR